MIDDALKNKLIHELAHTDTDVKGVIVVLIHELPGAGERAELMAMFHESYGLEDLPKKLHQLADSVADGNGQPLPGHGQTYTPN